MDDIQKINRRKISQICDTDKNEAFEILVLAGLKHFSLLYGDRPVDMNSLRVMSDKYVREFMKNSKFLKPNVPLRPDNSRTNDDMRMSRLDAMSHFPFADGTGHVDDILKYQSGGEEECKSATHRLLQMSKPGLLHLIKSTWNEMRLDKPGVRLCDLPEALHRLGLHISSELKILLEETKSSYLLDGSMKNYDEEHKTFTREQFISHNMFKNLVFYFIRRSESGRAGRSLNEVSRQACEELQFIQSVLSNGHDTRQDEMRKTVNHLNIVHCSDEEMNGVDRPLYDNELIYSDEECSDQDSLNESPQEQQQSQQRKTHSAQSNRQQNQSSTNTNYGRRTIEHHEHGRPSRPTNDPYSKHFRPASKQTNLAPDSRYMQNIKKVPSKIGGLVRSDRQQFQRSKSQTERNAMATLAKRRVDILTSMMGPEHLKDRNHHRPVSAPAHQSASQQRRHRERISDLDSGVAVSHIADSYLNSRVGKELLFSHNFSDDGCYGKHEDDGHADEDDNPFFPTTSHHSTHKYNQQQQQMQANRQREQYRKDVYDNYDRVKELNRVPGSNYNTNSTNYDRAKQGDDDANDYNNNNDVDHDQDESKDYVYLRDGQMKPYHYSANRINNQANDRLDDDYLGYDHISTATREYDRQLDRESRHLYHPQSAGSHRTTTSTSSKSASLVRSNSASTRRTNSARSVRSVRSTTRDAIVEDGEENYEEVKNAVEKSTAKGWRQSKGRGGGWVADFGPKHTHSDFAGNGPQDYEINYDPHNLWQKPWKKDKGRVTIQDRVEGDGSAAKGTTTLRVETEALFSDDEEDEEDNKGQSGGRSASSTIRTGSSRSSTSAVTPRTPHPSDPYILDETSGLSEDILQQMYAEIENRKIDRRLLESVSDLNSNRQQQEPYNTANLTAYTAHYNKHTSSDINQYSTETRTSARSGYFASRTDAVEDVPYAEEGLEGVADTRLTRGNNNSNSVIKSGSISPLPSGGPRVFRSTRNTTSAVVNEKGGKSGKKEGTPRSTNLLSAIEDTAVSSRHVSGQV